MDKIQFRQYREWTIVYKNGLLEIAGDSYLADEWLQQLCGVEVIEDEAGACMIDDRTAHPTLAAVEAAERDRDARLEAAAAKRAEANRLLAEAAELEG